MFKIFIEKEYHNLKLWIPVLFGTGVLTAIYCPFAPSSIALAAISSAFCIILGLSTTHLGLKILLCSISITGIGAIYTQPFVIKESIVKDKIVTKISGIITTITKGDIRTKLIIKHINLDKIKNINKVKLSVSNKHIKSPLKVGQKITLLANLYNPPMPEIIGGINFKLYAMYNKISLYGYSLAPITILAHNQGSFIEKIKAIIKDKLYSYDPTGKISGIATALITGDKSDIKQEIRKQYNNAGIAHILAISGLHMAMVAAIIFFILRSLLVFIPKICLHYNTKKWAAALTILITACYMVLCWPAVSAFRAFIMTTVFMIAIILDRHPLSLYNVMLAALIVMLINPLSVATISFHLSFAAVIALITAYEYYEPKLRVLKESQLTVINWSHTIAMLILTSLVATIATGIFTLYHFKQISLYGVLANTIIIPLFSFIVMPILILCLITMPFNLEFGVIKILYKLLDFIYHFANKISNLPFAIIYNNQSHFIWLALASISLLWLCIWREKWRYWSVPPLIISYFAIIFMDHSPDIYVSNNHKYLAYNDKKNHTLHVVGRRRNQFLENIWQQNSGMPNIVFHNNGVEQFLYQNPDMSEINKTLNDNRGTINIFLHSKWQIKKTKIL